jgi:hypothetical protein
LVAVAVKATRLLVVSFLVLVLAVVVAVKQEKLVAVLEYLQMITVTQVVQV